RRGSRHAARASRRQRFAHALVAVFRRGRSVEREVLDFDVQFVGAGPAGLAGALHLAQLIERHNQAAAAGAPGAALPEITIAVLEKAATVGAHGFSGAILDPRAMRELIPDYREQGCPIGSDVGGDDVYFFGASSQ